MTQIGRRIIFDNKTGKILLEMGEMEGDNVVRETINGFDFIDLPYGQDSDKFSRVKTYHVDITTKQVVFDELFDPIVNPQAVIEDLQNQLLIAKGVI